MTTISPEYLCLTLAEIIAGNTTCDVSRPVPLEVILAAVSTLATKLESDDSAQLRDQSAWLLQQFSQLVDEAT